MLSASRASARHLWTHEILAAIAACAFLISVSLPVIEAAGQDAIASGSPQQDSFDNPEAIIRHFDTELERLTKEPGTPSPSELAQHAEVNKTCSVATLSDPGRKLDGQTIYARSRAGTVVIGAIPNANRRHFPHAVFASGFVVHKEGLIVSNAHVLEAFRDMKAVGAMTSDGRVFPIKAVLAADRINDAAVLKIEATDLTPLPLARSVPVGTAVYCLSHPILNGMGTENGFFAFTQGIVSGRYRTRLMGDTPVNVLTITADYAQGSSGGPILNESGAVVGMVCQTLEIGDQDGGAQMTWKFARPLSSILAILEGSSTAPAQ